jgi:hypothetical protein
LEDQEVARNKNNDANQTHDPMHAMSSCPPKHEISHGESNDTEKRGYETMFGGTKTVLHNVGDEVLVLVDEEACDTN